MDLNLERNSSVIKVALDFAPGLHGHFLEYICNRYIFRVPYTKDTIFQSSGAAHTINTDSEYQKNKVVGRGHYSSFDHQYPKDTTHVLFVKHNSIYDIILLTNIFYRCHNDCINVDDFNINEITKTHQELMGPGSSSAEFKCNWYAKLMERHFSATEKQHTTDLPIFEFDYSSFFELDRFLLEIKKTARFLDHTFSYDDSLAKLWVEFMDRNQGYQTYQTANQLFIQIVSNVDAPIPDDWKIYAYLNYKLSTTFDLYDTPELFGLDTYPSSTKEVYQIVKFYIDNFDNLY